MTEWLIAPVCGAMNALGGGGCRFFRFLDSENVVCSR